MVANMLEQHGIKTRIDGEYLTSGVGELPAAGLVRVMAEERDFDRAREIIRDWEKKSPPDKNARVSKRQLGPIWFLSGVIVTVLAISFLLRPGNRPDGIDFNNDGRLDERFIYNGDHVVEIDVDANLDGKVDTVYHVDDRGVPLYAEVDTDFDGRFETKQQFERGLPKSADIDWDMDGQVDRHEEYVDGVLSEVILYAPNGNVVKHEYYEHGRLARADFASHDDGVFDTEYRYDRYGEIAEAIRK